MSASRAHRSLLTGSALQQWVGLRQLGPMEAEGHASFFWEINFLVLRREPWEVKSSLSSSIEQVSLGVYDLVFPRVSHVSVFSPLGRGCQSPSCGLPLSPRYRPEAPPGQNLLTSEST